MKTRKLTVLTEGGRLYGFGHLTRCLSITNCFRESGLTIDYIIDGDDTVSTIIEDQSFTLMDWLENTALFSKLKDSSFILIDSLRITRKQIKNLQNLDLEIIYIDDYKRENFLERGFIIDWTILADEKEFFFPEKEGITYLLGSQYTPIREPFKINQSKDMSDKINSIFVSFGGSDVRNMTPLVLETLAKHFPDLRKDIVIGAGFKNTQNINLFKDKNTTLVRNPNAKIMSDLMINNDIAISSGGQTLYELASLGVPTISILLVENARDDTEGWSEVGAMDYIGEFNDKNLMIRLVKSLQTLDSQVKRRKMQHAAKQYIGLNGSKKIVDAILNE